MSSLPGRDGGRGGTARARVEAFVVHWRAHLLAASLCGGLAGANVARGGSTGVAVAAAAAAVVACALPRYGYVAFALALLLAGWWWGSVRLDALDRSVLAPEIGRAARATVVVTGPVRRSEWALRAPAVVEAYADAVIREPVLLTLPPGRAPPQGARLELVAFLKAPRDGEGGGFDERAWLRRRGAHVVVAAHEWRVVGRRGGVAGLGDQLHRAIDRTATRGLAGDRRGVVAGVVLGEDAELSAETREAFRASGLYHLLAVSGQNVAFIVGGVLGLTWLLGLSRWLGQFAALAAIGAYVLAVGWQPSVVRAGVAGALASLAWLAARNSDRWWFLLAGAVVLLGWNPYSLLEPGFQLSFAAVAAIFLAVPPIERRLEGYPIQRTLAEVVAVSTACGLATAPILWLHFGAIPLFTVPANALAFPVVAPLLGLGLAAAAAHPVSPALAGLVAEANGWLAAYLAGCARAVAALPHAQLESLRDLAVVAGLCLGAVATARARGARRTLALATVGLAVAGFAAWQLAPRPPLLPAPAGLRVTALDVGQGDAILVQAPGAAMLVDQGPPEGRAAHQLRRLGVRRLALLVLTHPQRDHIGGAADVLERIRVDLVLDPRLPARSRHEDTALAAARRRGVRVVEARTGDVYRLGKLRVEVLWPDGPGPPGLDPNERAIVLLVSYGEVDALLTADAEGNVIVPLRPPPVEILKVAHHGSADERLPELLRLTRPRIALISVGVGNDYGHPTPSTLAALAAEPGLAVYRTDRDGRVSVESDGRGLSVREER